MEGPIHEREPEYDGTGVRHEPYGDPAYRGRGQPGDEVAAALEHELAEEYGADDPAQDHLSGRMLRAEERASSVPRLTEEDGGTNTVADDLWAERTTDGVDDRHELTAEEAAMHYVDEDDRILE